MFFFSFCSEHKHMHTNAVAKHRKTHLALSCIDLCKCISYCDAMNILILLLLFCFDCLLLPGIGIGIMNNWQHLKTNLIPIQYFCPDLKIATVQKKRDICFVHGWLSVCVCVCVATHSTLKHLMASSKLHEKAMATMPIPTTQAVGPPLAEYMKKQWQSCQHQYSSNTLAPCKNTWKKQW